MANGKKIKITNGEHRILLQVIEQHRENFNTKINGIFEKIDSLDEDIRILSKHVLKLDSNIMKVQDRDINGVREFDNLRAIVTENSKMINQYMSNLAGNSAKRLEQDGT